MAYPGFQRGGCLRSGPIRKVGGGSASGPRYENWGVGGGGGGGGGAVRFRSDAFVSHTENTLSLIINGTVSAKIAPRIYYKML